MTRMLLIAAVAMVTSCGPTREVNDTALTTFSVDATKLTDSYNRVASTAKNTGTPYTGRESFSRYVITTDANRIIVKSLTDLVSFTGGYNSTGLLVNGAQQGNGSQLGAQGSQFDVAFSLPGGTNTLELIDGPCGVDVAGVPPTRYTPIMSYQIPTSASHSVTTPTAPAKRIVFLSDSRSQGAFTDSGTHQASVYEANSILMRINAAASGSGAFAGAQVLVAGSGGRGWQDEGGSGAAITASLARLASQLDGTGTNLLIMDLGTNDWGLGVPAATIQATVTAWGTAFKAAHPTASCVCIGPTHRSGDGNPNAGGATLAQIDVAISAGCATNSIPYSSGFGFVTYPTNMSADLLHFKTAGMTEWEVECRAFLNANSIGY